MDFFSEIYGCYYRIVTEILVRAYMTPVSRQDIIDITEHLGFSESTLTVPHKLLSGQWPFLKKLDGDKYVSRLEHRPQTPLTLLQKRWIKSLIFDRRIRLFFTDASLSELDNALSDVEPLWRGDQFYYYDRYKNGDDFSSPDYRQSFRQIADSIRLGKTICFDYTSAKGKYSRKTCLPLKLEYSPKNDRFRLIALRWPLVDCSGIVRYRLDGIKNVVCQDYDMEKNAASQGGSQIPCGKLVRQQSGIEAEPREHQSGIEAEPGEQQSGIEAEPMGHQAGTEAEPGEQQSGIEAEPMGHQSDTAADLDFLVRQSYDREPVRLLIQNRRNALERAMLHFANYDKDTKQLDESTWECSIYYDSSMETELLIEILSFGPVVKAVGPKSFVELIRERLKRQRSLLRADVPDST